MLAIQKRHKTIKAITAGALSFAIGLTSVAAYVGSQYDGSNVVFNKERSSSGQTLGSSDQAATEGQKTVNDESVQGASSTAVPSPNTVTPQTSNWTGSTASPQSAPATSSVSSSSAPVSSAPSTTTPTAPIVPATPTPAPVPTPAPEPTCTLDLLGMCILPH